MTERSLVSTDQGKTCRICLSTDRPDQLVTPCGCRGSVAHVHSDCLRQYFTHKYKSSSMHQRHQMQQQLTCELCRESIVGFEVTRSKRCIKCSELKKKITWKEVLMTIVYLALLCGVAVVCYLAVESDMLALAIVALIWGASQAVAFIFAVGWIIKEECRVSRVTVQKVD